MSVPVSRRLTKRLAAAEGYLDLDLPERALAELEQVTEPGPWEATVEYLKGEALVAAGRFDEAVGPLKRAATLIPAPHNRDVWRSLSTCYRQNGDDDLAELTELFAENSPPNCPPSVIQVLQITLLLEQMVEEADPDEDLWFDDEEFDS